MSEVLLGIRPENTLLAESSENSIDAKIEICELMGDSSYIHLKSGKDNIICKYPSLFTGEKGENVKITFDMTKALFFDRDSGIRI